MVFGKGVVNLDAANSLVRCEHLLNVTEHGQRRFAIRLGANSQHDIGFGKSQAQRIRCRHHRRFDNQRVLDQRTLQLERTAMR